jgi:tetratricopeptide (TPR) repeat protein
MTDTQQVHGTKFRSERLPLWVWFALSALLLLALAVIFVLPRLVSEYELPFTRRPVLIEPAIVQAPGATLNAVSPFDEAQRARQRKEAQDVLASLLMIQAQLDQTSPRIWAAGQYEEAVEHARLGDEAYRTQQFAAAAEHYRQTEQIFMTLSESVPDVFQEFLSSGEQHLQAGQSREAEQQFEMALLLDQESDEARTGLQRARALDEVTRLLREGTRQQQAGQLDDALASFQQAAALDRQHQAARQSVEGVRAAIADREFAAVMSQGFAALQNNRQEEAISIFQRAQRMRPDSRQAQEALTQTRDQLAVNRINRHQEAAVSHEQAERWEQAVAEYEAALAVDSNLVFAINGRDYAQKRLHLDRLLEDAIARPQRLADPAVYEQTAGIYYAGRDLDNAGPRLQGQLDNLEQLLRSAQTPVQVELISDNATQVTVFQVGELGQFGRQTLTLAPGTYVAVGTRPGYRDVREEFTVGFGQEPGPVTIRCNELVAVNRR